MTKTAKLELEGKVYDLPTMTGSEGEKAVDVSNLRSTTGYITLDDGYGNTGSCTSAITFLDGEKGILRYRGIPIEELAEHSTFVETSYLLIYGHLPSKGELKRFSTLLTRHSMLHEYMKRFYDGYPGTAHPMAILAARLCSLSSFYPEAIDAMNSAQREATIARLPSQMRPTR